MAMYGACGSGPGCVATRVVCGCVGLWVVGVRGWPSAAVCGMVRRVWYVCNIDVSDRVCVVVRA